MFALPLALALQGAAATPPMPPPSSPVEESRFGVTLHDPYRGLENLKDPAVAGWIRAQSDYTRGLLDSIPQRAAVLADIQRLERATPSQLVDAVLMPGDRILLQRRSAGAIRICRAPASATLKPRWSSGPIVNRWRHVSRARSARSEHSSPPLGARL